MTNSPSRHPSQPPEDWDHPESLVNPSAVTSTTAPTPSRVVFPSQGGAAAADPDVPTSDALPSHSHRGGRAGKRTLSELLKLHAEKGTDVHFTSEEAAGLEELLGQWVRLFFLFPFIFRLSPVSRRAHFFVGSVLVLCGRRSTRVRRHTKGMMNFSHGHKVTRLCSCTARLLSTPLLGIPHIVRVRVLLLDHSGAFPSLSPSIHVLPRPPSSQTISSISAVRSRSILHAIQQPKSCAHDYRRLYYDPSRLLTNRHVLFVSLLFLYSRHFAIFDCVSYPCFLF